jgi:glycosyltransferase involved in cell wall biosynthesis
LAHINELAVSMFLADVNIFYRLNFISALIFLIMRRRLLTLVIPVYNEAHVLPRSMERLIPFLYFHFGDSYELVISNNGSTDQTLTVSNSLAKAYKCIRVLNTEQKGRGGALAKAWSQSSAEVLSYMDVDLSSQLEAFPRLVDSLLSGGYEVATGSRLLRPEWTTRSFTREFASRGYNRLVRTLFRTHFSDAQCGFKALRSGVAVEILPLVEDTQWFFDTELLVLAEKLGYRIYDCPVPWVEDSDSRVRIFQTVIQDLRGLARLYRQIPEKRSRVLPTNISSVSQFARSS